MQLLQTISRVANGSCVSDDDVSFVHDFHW